MEVIVFWLVPVALLTVLILVLLRVVHPETKKPLLIVEPLGLLVKNWHLARVEPAGDKLPQLIRSLSGLRLSTHSPLEQIISRLAAKIPVRTRPKSLSLVNQQLVGPLAELFVVESGRQRQSILIGPLEQLQELVEETQGSKWRQLSDRAVKNGYLALAVATAHSHGRGDKPIRHQLEGLLLLEPEIDADQSNRLQAQPSVRFLTAAPVNFANHLYQQIFTDRSVFGLDASELATLLPPKFAEADLKTAQIVGGADLVARHQAIRLWQADHHCTLVSRSVEDHQLPLTPLQQLP